MFFRLYYNSNIPAEGGPQSVLCDFSMLLNHVPHASRLSEVQECWTAYLASPVACATHGIVL